MNRVTAFFAAVLFLGCAVPSRPAAQTAQRDVLQGLFTFTPVFSSAGGKE